MKSTRKVSKLFDLINKHDSWEEFLGMLKYKDLDDYIAAMEEWNKVLEE